MARSARDNYLPRVTDDPVTNRWVIGLFGLFVAELIAWNVGAPLDALRWWPIGSGAFRPWQLVTHVFVQGREAVVGVVLSLLVLTMLLPMLRQRFSDSTLLRALASGAAGGLLVALTADALGLVHGGASGWMSLIEVLLILFGLANPDQEIRVYFVFPVSGRNFVWGLLVVSVLLFLASASLQSAQAIGTWAGTFAWWHWQDRRRATLRAQAASIESQLRGLRVIQGGKDDPGRRGQGGQDVH